MQKAFEEWRDIPNFEGYYQVSNIGNVRSVDRLVKCGKGMKLQKGKILKQYLNAYGYNQVMLCKGRPRLYRVHRLVAETFIPNPSKLPQVNHKDENKTNNRVDNLEWCTCLYNLMYNDLHHRRNNKNNRNSIPVAQIKDG